MEQNSRLRNELSHNYDHLTFDKGAKTIQWKKDSILKNGASSTDGQHQKNANVPILISFYKAEVDMDQGPPHRTRYTHTYRG